MIGMQKLVRSTGTSLTISPKSGVKIVYWCPIEWLIVWLMSATVPCCASLLEACRWTPHCLPIWCRTTREWKTKFILTQNNSPYFTKPWHNYSSCSRSTAIHGLSTCIQFLFTPHMPFTGWMITFEPLCINCFSTLIFNIKQTNIVVNKYTAFKGIPTKQINFRFGEISENSSANFRNVCGKTCYSMASIIWNQSLFKMKVILII